MDFHSGYERKDHTQDVVTNFGGDGYQVLRTANNATASHQTESNTPESETYLRNYLKQYICDVRKVNQAENILVVEEDSRIQRILQNLIQEENATAQCRFLDSVDDFLDCQQTYRFDLVIVNYYLADDEVDYDFWEKIREDFPRLEVILLSHVNDREYYQKLEELGNLEKLGEKAQESLRGAGLAGPLEAMTAKMKNFLEHIFGGRNGNQ